MMINLTPQQLAQIASATSAAFFEMAKANGGRVVVEVKGDEVIFTPSDLYVETLEKQLADARTDARRYFDLVAKIRHIGGQAVVSVAEGAGGTFLDVATLPPQVLESAAVAALRAAWTIDQRRVQDLHDKHKAQREGWPAVACDRIRDWLHPNTVATIVVDRDGDLMIAPHDSRPTVELVEVIKCS